MRRTWIFAWAWTIGAVLAAEAQTAYNALRVSQLPPCNVARQGRLLTVNDADPDCQTGSGDAGSQYALCVCDPVLGWQALTPGGGGGAGLVGDLGAESRVIARTAGTGGDELEASPNLKQDAAGNLIIEDLSGSPSEIWLSTVSTAPILGRNGIGFWIRGNTGGYAPLQAGWAVFEDPSNSVAFAGGQKIANGKSIEFSDGIDYNRGLGRFSDGMLGPRDSSGNPMGWKDKGEVNVPQASPPWACDSDHDGGTYRDSTGPGTRCECFFASGDGWVNTLPGRVGSDCS